jgi:hypothetical protein
MDFPAEIILQILAFVESKEDLVNCAKVSRLWKELAYSPFLWKDETLSFVKTPKNLLPLIQTGRTSQITKVDLENMTDLEDSDVISILKGSPGIEKLNLKFCTRLTANFTNFFGERIKWLSISGCTGIYIEDIAKCPQLEHLSIFNCQLTKSNEISNYIVVFA